FGVSEGWAGLLMASYSLMQFLFAPVWGRLSDRYGRRPVILVSLAGSVVTLALAGLATSFWMLLAARALAGVAGANISAAQAYVADVTTPENRAKGMGMVGAAIGLGFVLGPGFGGFLGQWGYALPAFVASGLAAVNLALAFLLLRESLPAGGPAEVNRRSKLLDLAALRASASRPVVGGVLAAGFLFLVAFSAMEATFSFWARDQHGWDQTEVGYLFFFIGIVLVGVQGGAIGPLTRRFGEARLLVAGLLLVTAGLVALPFATTLPLVLGAAALLALGAGLSTPSMSSLLSRSTEASNQGATLGLFQSLQSLGRVAGPVWGTLAFTHLGMGSPFLLGAALTAVVVAVALAVMREVSKAERETVSGPALPKIAQ
ncbi:MAG TPA: MFS transporter, partial [Candidatus Thermoplasmatota archaeon]|nr:MFS transporter [Candidatus Thermoplasmatota archaeon]